MGEQSISEVMVKITSLLEESGFTIHDVLSRYWSPWRLEFNTYVRSSLNPRDTKMAMIQRVDESWRWSVHTRPVSGTWEYPSSLGTETSKEAAMKKVDGLLRSAGYILDNTPIAG